MDLRLLQSFIAVIEEGSLSAASRRLNLSQPALSQQIQSLEEQLGESLLLRRPRGVEATAAGELLLGHARTLLAHAERLRGDFQGRRELETGSVSFGIIPTIAPHLLPRLLAPFRKAHPGVVVSIHEARTSELVTATAAGDIEFAILSDVTAADRRRGSVQVRELFREPLLLAAPSSHPLALRREPPSATDLDADELIHLSGGHCLTDRTLKLCRIRRTNPGLRCDQLATAVAMVSANMGVTVVPELAVRDHPARDVLFRPFAEPGLHRVISLMKRRRAKLSPAAERLLEALKPERASPGSAVSKRER